MKIRINRLETWAVSLRLHHTLLSPRPPHSPNQNYLASWHHITWTGRPGKKKRTILINLRLDQMSRQLHFKTRHSASWPPQETLLGNAVAACRTKHFYDEIDKWGGDLEWVTRCSKGEIPAANWLRVVASGRGAWDFHSGCGNLSPARMGRAG